MKRHACPRMSSREPCPGRRRMSRSRGISDLALRRQPVEGVEVEAPRPEADRCRDHQAREWLMAHGAVVGQLPHHLSTSALGHPSLSAVHRPIIHARTEHVRLPLTTPTPHCTVSYCAAPHQRAASLESDCKKSSAALCPGLGARLRWLPHAIGVNVDNDSARPSLSELGWRRQRRT